MCPCSEARPPAASGLSPRLPTGAAARRVLAALALLLASPGAWAQEEPPPPPPAQKLTRYVIAKGDSCQGLAQRIYGDARRIDLIHQFNPELGPLPHYLKEGQVIFFPPPHLAPPLSGPDAKLTALRNRVTVSNPATKAGQTNDPLSRGHKVSTDEGSSAEVTFRDETRLQLGEHTLVVIFGDSARKASQSTTVSDTQLLSGQLRAHLGSLAGGEQVTVKTDHGDVGLGTGEAQVQADKKATRLSVYSGQSTLTGKSQSVKVGAGFGSRASADGTVTAPRPLPAAPVWLSAPPPSFLSAGRRASFVAEFGPGKGKGKDKDKLPAAVIWHVQLARDPLFNALVLDTKVPVTTTKLEAQRLGPGHYYARVSAVDDEQFEGPFSTPARVSVILARLVRDEAKNSVTAQVVPGNVYCGLDGSGLAPLSTALRKAKGQFKKLRCGPTADSKLASEMELPPPYVAPYSLKPKLARADGDKREGQLLLSLADAKGQPLVGSLLELELPAGVSGGMIEETEHDGDYQAPVWWSEGMSSLPIKVKVDSSLDLEAPDLDLPGPTPPQATEPRPPAPPRAPPPQPPPRTCGCQLPGHQAPAGAAWLLPLAALAAWRRPRHRR